MQQPLIKYQWIERINRSHARAIPDILDSDEVPALKEILVRQLAAAEQDVLTAMEKLLDKYHHAHGLAHSAEQRAINEPNVHLTGLLYAAGIKTENDEHEQGNLY